MADVEIHTIDAEAFHLMVNRTGDDIAWGQLATFVKIGHKPGTVRTFQVCAFAA